MLRACACMLASVCMAVVVASDATVAWPFDGFFSHIIMGGEAVRFPLLHQKV